MRTLTTIRLIGAIALALITLHCASGSDSSSNSCQSGYLNSQYGCQPQCGGTNAVWYGGTCVPVTTTQSCGTAGYINSQYGCLPQCGTNAVWYGNQCVAVTNTGYYGGGYPYGGGYYGGYPYYSGSGYYRYYHHNR